MYSKWLVTLSMSVAVAATINILAEPPLEDHKCMYTIGWNGEKICTLKDCTNGVNCGTLWAFYDCYPYTGSTCVRTPCRNLSKPVYPPRTKQCGWHSGVCECRE